MYNTPFFFINNQQKRKRRVQKGRDGRVLASVAIDCNDQCTYVFYLSFIVVVP